MHAIARAGPAAALGEGVLCIDSERRAVAVAAPEKAATTGAVLLRRHLRLQRMPRPELPGTGRLPIADSGWLWNASAHAPFFYNRGSQWGLQQLLKPSSTKSSSTLGANLLAPFVVMVKANYGLLSLSSHFPGADLREELLVNSSQATSEKDLPEHTAEMSQEAVFLHLDRGTLDLGIARTAWNCQKTSRSSPKVSHVSHIAKRHDFDSVLRGIEIFDLTLPVFLLKGVE